MTPRITVVTPSLNQAPWLEATLRSVLDQGYQNLEYIVLDGGSTDGSIEILERYRSRVSTLRIGPDGGQTQALVDGFAMATGDILAWLNSDDMYEPGVLSEVAQLFAREPIEFAYGDASWIDAGGDLVRRKREMPFNWFVWTRTYNYIPQPSCFWRRGLYEAVGGLDRSFDLAMDADLFARFAERTRPRYVRRYWSRMRVHPSQKNTVFRSQSDREADSIRRRYTRVGGVTWGVERAVARGLRVAYRAATGAYFG